MSFSSVDVITTKRDGGRLTDGQIDWVLAAYTRGDVADEQMSALAMAILLNGMDTRAEDVMDREAASVKRSSPINRNSVVDIIGLVYESSAVSH